jgi:hypothetical protein
MQVGWHWCVVAGVVGYALGVVRSQRLLTTIVERTLDLRDSRRPDPNVHGDSWDDSESTPPRGRGRK